MYQSWRYVWCTLFWKTQRNVTTVNVLLRSIGQFSLNSFTFPISLFYLHVACGVRVNLNPSIDTEVIDREAYTSCGVKLSLLQAKAKCKIKENQCEKFFRLTLLVFFLGLYIIKSSLVRHVLGSRYKTKKIKKKTVLIVILFSLVHSCYDLSLSVKTTAG